MSVLPSELAPVLAAAEARVGPLREHDVSKAIQAQIKSRYGPDDELPLPVLAESIAFDFSPEHQDDEKGWGTYYGLMYIFPTGNGKMAIYPHIDQVNEKILEYWQARSHESSHSLLQERYADLVWDFSPRIRGKGAGVAYPRIVIDSVLRFVGEGRYQHEQDAIRKLRRALELGLRIGDRSRIEEVVVALLRFEDEHADLSKRGTWGYSYDLLLGNKNIPITPEQEEEIIQHLERCLTDGTAIPDGKEFPQDHFAVEFAAERLAGYYKRTQKPDDMARVLHTYAETVARAAKQTMALIGSAWIRKAYDSIRSFGLQEDADALAVELNRISEGCVAEMSRMSFRMQVPEGKLNAFLDELLSDTEDEAVVQLAEFFIHNGESTEERVKENAKEHFLSSMFFRPVLHDTSGREIARIGSVKEDLDGQVVLGMRREMQFLGPYLCAALDELVTRFHLTANRLTDRVLASPFFADDRREVLHTGIEAYLSGNHLASLHLLVPQVENAIRQLLALSGRPVYSRLNRYGGLDFRLLGDMLADPVIESVFGARAAKYFRVLLTDNRGWNVRNEVCHGLSPLGKNCWLFSDRILHLLLFFSCWRLDDSPDSSEEAQ